jgi:hypothetical protein
MKSVFHDLEQVRAAIEKYDETIFQFKSKQEDIIMKNLKKGNASCAN